MSDMIMDLNLWNDFFDNYQKEDENLVRPLLLAVSGHRHIDPESLEIVRKKTFDFLFKTGVLWHDKQRSNQKKSPDPIFVLCGMAIGADLLVAREVLRLKKEKPDLNYNLVAVLPMPKKIYEEDFSDGPERMEYIQMLDKADYTMEIPLTNEGQTWMEVYPGKLLPTEYRMPQYELLGKYLAANCLDLLALWDGMEVERIEKDPNVIESDKICPMDLIKPSSRGGTADVVRMKMEGSFTKSILSDPSVNIFFPFGVAKLKSAGHVFHIATPRIVKGSVQLANNLAPGEFRIYKPGKMLKNS